MKSLWLGITLAISTHALWAETTIPEIPLRLRTSLPADTLEADKAAARLRLAYNAGKEKITYFADDDTEITQPAKSGYFRKVLGKTADGRRVVQDFYQDSATAKTAPYALVKEAPAAPALADNGSEVGLLIAPLQAGKTLGRAVARLRADAQRELVADGAQVFFDRNGALTLIIPWHAGTPAGRSHFYHAGRLYAQSLLPQHADENTDTLPELRAFAHTHRRLFYLDGKLLALAPPFLYGTTASDGRIVIYRNDGTLLASGYGDDPEQWQLRDRAGQALAPETATYAAAAAELQAALAQIALLDSYFIQTMQALRYGVRHDENGVPVVEVSDMDVPLRLTTTLPENLLDAAKVMAEADIGTRVHGAEKIFYCDAAGQKAAQAVAGGYFRKLLGKTADGRQVVQDFYQDSGKPRTSLFALRADAAADDFRKQMADSPVVTYNHDGSTLNLYYPVAADKTTQRFALYDEGHLLLQTALPPGTNDPTDSLHELRAFVDYQRLYTPAGALLMRRPPQDGDGITVAYRADGSLLATISKDADGGQVRYWAANGLPPANTAAFQQVAQEYAAQVAEIDARFQEVMRAMAAPSATGGQ